MSDPIRIGLLFEESHSNIRKKYGHKVTFSDREGDDVHRNDTMQELVSLSERFTLKRGGKSARLAKQFIDGILARLKHTLRLRNIKMRSTMR